MYNHVVNDVRSNSAKPVLTIATARAVEIADVNVLRIDPLSFLLGLAIVEGHSSRTPFCNSERRSFVQNRVYVNSFPLIDSEAVFAAGFDGTEVCRSNSYVCLGDDDDGRSALMQTVWIKEPSHQHTGSIRLLA